MKEFLIDHIDPLGQGVFKDKDKIYFIPKTLPDETGTFQVIKQSKGVSFGQLASLTRKSPLRINPECDHFEQCSGCHFLHTTYDNEIEIKINVFRRMLRGISDQPLKVIRSHQRLHYRNRIQLHYDQNKIGFKQSKTNRIISVPNCLIMQPELKDSYLEFLKNWQMTRKKLNQPSKGHVELYLKEQKVAVNWNDSYAAGGFTQVNQTLNMEVQSWIGEYFKEVNGGLLELFAGEGNLGERVKFDRRICVDLYDSPKSDQISLNLFSENSLQEFQKSSTANFECLFIDPPRSGFKGLKTWIQSYQPQDLLYMSCNPVTQINDIKPILSEYEIKEVLLIDFFPSTFHFESIIAMRRKL